MVTVIKVVVAVFIGVLLGLLTTIYSLDQANQGAVVGPWHGASRESLDGVDPYALAANARASLLPLGPSEGLSFVAETDTKGAALSGRCDYNVVGQMPQARFWTLSLLTPEGFPTANPASRYGYTSADVLRMNHDPAVITISSEAQSGNWLPSGQARHYALMLRLYDTSLSTAGTVLKPDALPTIERIACR